MGTSNKRKTYDALETTQTVSPELSFSPALLLQLFTRLAGYRISLLIEEVMVFPNGDIYYVCPRCGITLEREFMSYCDRCGQCLGWKDYKKAKIVYAGNRKKYISD